MKRILLLGKRGMLGHLVEDYLSSLDRNYNLLALDRTGLDVLKLSNLEIENIINQFNPDYVINCIGLVNKNKELNESNSKKVNSDFPHFLAYLGIKYGWKLIHISTDCYLDQDLYGKSKYLGEINDRHNLTIRTSIIGPEIAEGTGLFNWFMNQHLEVNGFTRVFWDGVTTLELTKFIEAIIKKEDEKLVGIVDFRSKQSISKYALLMLLKKIFNKKIKINQNTLETKDRRNKNADYWCFKDYPTQLNELKEYMEGKKEKYSKYF